MTPPNAWRQTVLQASMPEAESQLSLLQPQSGLTYKAISHVGPAEPAVHMDKFPGTGRSSTDHIFSMQLPPEHEG